MNGNKDWMCVLSDEARCGGGAELTGCGPPRSEFKHSFCRHDDITHLSDSFFNRNQPMKSGDQVEE